MEEPVVKLGAVTERPGWGPGSNLIQFTDVPFIIENTGDAGIVSIPTNQFTAERAHREVMAKVDEIMRLRNTIGG